MADRTYEEIQAARESQGGETAPDRTYEEILAAREPKREYSTGQAMHDVQLSLEEGLNIGTEFIADAGMLPARALGRYHQAVQGGFGLDETNQDPNVFKRIWKGASTEPTFGLGPSEVTGKDDGGVAIGDITKEMFNPDELTRDQYIIPEGEGPSWLPNAKKAAKFGTEMLVTAPLAGPKYLAQSVKAIAPSVAGAIGGSEIDKSLGGTGEKGEIIGMVSGAIAGDPKSLLDMTKMVGSKLKNVYEKGKSIVDRRTGNVAEGTVTDAQLRTSVAELLRQVYPDDPTKVEENLNLLVPRLRAALDKGEAGTIGQITDDAGILKFEKEMTTSAAGKERANQLTLDQINAGITEKSMLPLTKTAQTGVTENAAKIPAEYAGQQVKEATDLADDAAREVTRTADTKLAESRAAQDVVEESAAAYPSSNVTSENLSKTVGVSRDASLKQAGKAFDDVGGTGVTGTAVRESVKKNFTDRLGPDDADMFETTFPKTFDRISKLGMSKSGEISIDTLSNVMSLAASEANQIKKGAGSGTALQYMDDFVESLYTALESGGGSAAQRKKAAGLYRDHMNRYGPKSKVGKALDDDVAKFDTAVLKRGSQNVDLFNKVIKGDRKAHASGEQSLRALFKQQAIDLETGAVKPTAVNAFLNDKSGFGEHLKAYPKLREEFEAMRDGARALDSSTSAATDAQKTAKALRDKGAAEVKSIEKSAPAQFGKSGDDVKVIKDNFNAILSGKKVDRAPALTELVKSTKSNPQAYEDLRRAGLDSFTDFAVNADGVLTHKGFTQFKRDRKMYEKAGLYSSDELDLMEAGLVEAQKLFLHDKGSRLAKLPDVKQRLAGTLAALGGAKLGAYSFGSPLIGASLGRKEAVSWLDTVTKDQARQIAFELTTDPKKFIDIFDKLDKKALTDRQGKEALAKLLARVGSTTITGEEE